MFTLTLEPNVAHSLLDFVLLCAVFETVSFYSPGKPETRSIVLARFRFMVTELLRLYIIVLS